MAFRWQSCWIGDDWLVAACDPKIRLAEMEHISSHRNLILEVAGIDIVYDCSVPTRAGLEIFSPRNQTRTCEGVL